MGREEITAEFLDRYEARCREAHAQDIQALGDNPFTGKDHAPVLQRMATKDLVTDLEILRLARLGLWARETGIPTLKELAFRESRCFYCGRIAERAYSALPGETPRGQPGKET